jgi:uncharacterized membrane protein YdjX (TVP38/TMEM64 family)
VTRRRDRRPDPRRPRSGAASFAARLLREAAFLATSLPLGALWSLLLVLLLFFGVALVPLLVGFPILGLAVLAWVGAARLERRRVRLLLRTRVPDPYRRPPPAGTVSARLRTLVGDPALWRDLAYVLLLPAIGLAEFALFLAAFALPWPLLTYPFWHRSLPEGGVQLGPGEWLDAAPEALLVALSGLLVAAAGLLLVRFVARAHAALALALLGAAGYPFPRLARRTGLLALGAASAAVLAVALLAGYAPFDLGAAWEAVSSPERVRAFFEGFGIWGPVVFFAAQAAQVLASVLPGGPLTLAGAAAFGPWLAFALSLSGAAAGSVAAFLLGRRFGRPMVARMVGGEVLDRYAGKMGSDGWWLIPVLLLPLPAGGDAVCAVAGLSEISLGRFALMMTLGRVPGTALGVLTATGLATGSPGLLAAGGFALALLGAAAFLYARKGKRADTSGRETRSG